MAANMGTFMNKDIPQFLRGRPLYFIRSCMNTFQNAVDQFHEDMIKEIIPRMKYEVRNKILFMFLPKSIRKCILNILPNFSDNKL